MTEKHSYEIIVLDLDGTLTNRDKVITPKTKQRLMELQERGKKIVLASGRPTPGVLPLARELDLAKYGSYILSFNGGRITNCKTGEIIFSRSLPQEANQKIIRLAEEEQVGLLSYDEAGAKLLTNQSDSPYAKLEARINGMELVQVDDYYNGNAPRSIERYGAYTVYGFQAGRRRAEWERGIAAEKD